MSRYGLNPAFGLFCATVIFLWFIFATFTLHVSFETRVGFDIEVLRIYFFFATLIPCFASTESLKFIMDEREKEANQKADFFANISHEMRTPLTTMIGWTEMLLATDLRDTPQVFQRLKIIKSCGSHLIGLINDTLDYSKIEKGNLKLEMLPFNLEQLVKDAHDSFQLLTRKKGLFFVVESKLPSARYVRGDQFRLTQCLNNLLSNAQKFTKKGGSVKLVCEEKEKESEKEIWVEFSIIDTGIGMSLETLRMVTRFRPFTQADTSITRLYGGTGLGLAITKKLIEMMGGTLMVSSELNKGSKFSFQVKFQIISPVELKVTPKKVKSPLRKSRLVLLVEDNLLNQQLLKAMVESCGFTCKVASNGLEAYQICQTQKFDIIYMDLMMPIMGGIEATVLIRKSGACVNSTIVLLSANQYPPQMNGFDFFLTKPLSIKKLQDNLQEISNNLWNDED